ncbi:MAG: DNA-binding protein [Zestosphaera sp.]
MIKAVKLEEGSILPDTIERIILEERLKGGFMIGIGGLKKAEIGYFNPVTSTYVTEFIDSGEEGMIEVVSLVGNYLLRSNGTVFTHLHVTLSRRDLGVKGGHLVRGVVRPHIEIFLVEVGEELKKVFRHRDVG